MTIILLVFWYIQILTKSWTALEYWTKRDVVEFYYDIFFGLYCTHFDVLMTVHLGTFISVINQLDEQNFVLQ